MPTDPSTPYELHGWIVAESVRCVCCPGCGFAFDAMHEDTGRDGYTCPLCGAKSDD